MTSRPTLRLVAAFMLVAAGLVSAPPAREAAGEADILDRIRAVPGVVSVQEAASSVPETRFFRVELEQPVDHANPTGATFRQRLTILHRDPSAPTVLVLNGYYVNPNPIQYELTALLQANQIHVEHRYFPPSRPAPTDWQFLTVAQSAADHHEVVRAFETIYSGKWVSTGASKGGMATVFFRYFYPGDVDAAVPYVAPSSHGTRDPRYVSFVAGLGTAKCRKKLLGFQKRALKKRAKLEAYMTGTPYDVLGRDRALEFAILEFPFIFWQYNDERLCDEIPGAGATPRQIYDFLDRVVFVESYGDGVLTAFEPYWYQAATQLGGPAVGEAGLGGLVRYPGQDGPEILPPMGVPKPFDAALMPEIERWVLEDAERMLFVYGANDPWSTNAFAVSAENDSYRMVVAGQAGNHGSQILELAAADRDVALGKLGEWLGVPGLKASAAALASDPRYRIDRPTRQELFLR